MKFDRRPITPPRMGPAENGRAFLFDPADVQERIAGRAGPLQRHVVDSDLLAEEDMPGVKQVGHAPPGRVTVSTAPRRWP